MKISLHEYAKVQLTPIFFPLIPITSAKELSGLIKALRF